MENIKIGIRNKKDKFVNYFKEENENVRKEINNFKNGPQRMERKMKKNNLIIFELKPELKRHYIYIGQNQFNARTSNRRRRFE